MMIVAILACLSAVYYAISLDGSLRAGGKSRTPLARPIEVVAGLIPFVASGALQYWKLRQGGASGPRLWLPVGGTAIGAPILGFIVMLIAAFAIYGKTPNRR